MKRLFLFSLLWAIALAAYPQWALLSEDFCPNSSVTAFDSTVISGSGGFGPNMLTVSHDNGNTWTGSDPFQSDYFYYLCSSETEVFACTSEGIFKAPKNTLNWSSYNEGLPGGAIFKFCIKDDTLLTSSDSSIFMRIAGDTTWTILCNSPVAGIYDLDYDGNTLFLSGSNGAAESHDFGLSWTLWPVNYSPYVYDAVIIKGDTIIGASPGGIYRKLISTGNISKVSNGLTELWSPYEDDYFGKFEMFLRIGDRIFVCGETGIYLLSPDTWNWEFTGMGNRRFDAISNNEETMFAAVGYHGIWGCPLDQLIVHTDEIPATETSLRIYPNPASSKIQINTHSMDGRDAVLTVTDLSGRQLLRTLIHETSALIDVHPFPQGVYLVKLSDNRQVLIGKFVKQ